MKLNQILGTQFPIMQGGMAQVATGAFAAAVSNAGALGIIGTGAMNGEMMRKEIETAKSLTDKPFGVNLMMMNPDVEEMAQIIAEEKPSVVTTGAGNPGKYVKMWKEQSIKVIPVVSSVALAKRLEREGVDAIIAEGTESGGHIGELTTMVLLPQVADAVSVPVIGAGGIASGRQMKAAEILGAVGVQIGTVLLGSEECPIHANYKNALIKAKDRATVVTGRSVGVPVRVLKNGMTRDYLELEQSGAEKMELEKFTLGALRRAVHEGDVDRGSLMAGQDASYIKEIRPLRVILEEMMKEYESL
ncbi:nitronate monooxygenase [Anaerovoracaceae bacterium SGI.174]